MSPEPSFEREIKLRFDSAEAAHAAVDALGATLRRARRLQDDVLLDGPEGALEQRGCALRVRRDGDAAAVTWKGPALPSAMKLREEIETAVESADVLLRVFAELGFTPRFRYQKYRTEFTSGAVIIAIDETPLGVFVEIEGAEAGIDETARRLGRTAADYLLSSYRRLFLDARAAAGIAAADAGDMVFERS
jgi:adenylate cyclase class 2